MAKGPIKHYGVKERSGRYPFGSGGNSEQRGTSWLEYVRTLEKQGLTETEIARSSGMTTTQLRQRKSLEKAEKRKSDYAQALRLKEKGVSNVEIGKQMGINESSVRSLLNPAIQERSNITKATSNMLREAVEKKTYVDVGVGTENHLGISRTRLKNAISELENDGYKLHYINVEQLGTGNKTTILTLTKDTVDWATVNKNKSDIKTLTDYSEDGGRSFLGLEPVNSINSKRIDIRYHEDGGTAKDGVIELRRGVPELSLNNSRYAQVRIGVDGTHYLKGMAVYGENMPDGVDIIFNTNKTKDTPKSKVFKEMKEDKESGGVDVDNPFGATVRQKHYLDNKENSKLSALNMVYEEGDWDKWSKNLSSQMLSKQRPIVAKKQLDLSHDISKTELNDIMALTNPSVKKLLLDKYADGADSAAVHLKAAGLPRQSTHVLLPLTSIKENEIYAPNYRNGEEVALIRFPHGGVFEIPVLIVNNKNREAQRIMGKDAPDAIGIHPKAAAQMSGADNDGDTAIVIPTSGVPIKASAPLQGLKDFDPRTSYPSYEGMKKITPRMMQQKMGDVSNLVTDMTIKGASDNELAAAVRHSMVIIDSEKHNLNYKQSHVDNGIGNLKKKYQGGERRGASTLISRASSEKRVTTRKFKGIDPKTGKKLYEDIIDTYVDKKGKTQQRTEKSTKLQEESDAFKLSSGTQMEKVYATHSNKMKLLANEARKASVALKPLPYSSQAKKIYSTEVDSLNAKLNIALQNKPLERQAQLLANKVVSAKRQSNPDMQPADIKKVKGQALDEARTRVGAKKQQIMISPQEWKAIQSGAITGSKLSSILNNSDIDQVKQLATPRTAKLMTPSKTTKAKQLLASGYTQSQVADALGVSVSTIKNTVNE